MDYPFSKLTFIEGTFIQPKIFESEFIRHFKMTYLILFLDSLNLAQISSAK